MLFRKIYIEKTPDSNGNPVERWYMILRTFQDVLEYTNLDSELMVQALFALPDSITKSHLEGARERVLHASLQAASFRLKENEKVYPVKVLSDLVEGKAKTMFKMLERGDTILVQQGGGYCDYDSYIKIWDAKVTEEIDKPGCYFPSDTNPIETDLLFIENSERVPVDFERQIYNIVGYDYNKWQSVNPNSRREFIPEKLDKKQPISFKLNQLKLRDPNYVAQMIAKAKVIAVQTQIADKNQFDKFMQLFSQLSNKTIYISTTYVDELKAHPLYLVCSDKHTIKFI